MMTKVPTPRRRRSQHDRDELVDHLLGVAVDEAGEAVDRGDREDAGRDGAPHAADAVDREHVERVVDVQPLAQEAWRE